MSAGDESQILDIEDAILHPKYDLSNAYQDISVIKLKPNKGKLYINIRCGRVMADNIAYAKFRKSLLIW